MTRVVFDNTDLSEFGYTFQKDIDEVPEHDYEEVTILGKNGTLLIDNKRMKNVSESYDIAITDNSTADLDKLRNFLASKVGFKRLEDDIRPDRFVMAKFDGMNSRLPSDRSKATATMNFERKPERWLKSGETPVSTSSEDVTYTGNPVSIDNPSGLTALTGLSVDIEPVQDLNGYEYPWVGGAGKNKLPSHAVGSTTTNGVTFTVADDGTVIVSGTATAATNFFLATGLSITGGILSGCPSGGSISSYYMNARVGGSWQTQDTGSGRTFTGTCDQVAITIANGYTANNLVFKPMIRLASETDATYAPYSNICPITGHTSATVQRAGKNLFEIAQADKWLNSNGVIISDTDSAVSQKIPLIGGVTLTLSTYGESGALAMCFYKTDGTLLQRTAQANVRKLTATSPNGTAYIYAGRYKKIGGEDVQLELGTEASDYEPYQGQTVTIDLNGTVYGGTLDVTTGVLTVDRQYYTFEWGTSGLAVLGNYTRKSISLSSHPSVYPPKPNKPQLCDKLPYKAAYNEDSAHFYCNGASALVYMPTGTSADETITLCYELATPTTVQLTPQQVSLLTGTNIISTDMNSMTVTLSNPAELENPTLFESKPIIRVYGNGTLNVNDIYITVANSPYTYIDIDCELMDCYHGSNNANQYVSFSTTDYVTLRSGVNYFSYSGFTKVEVTPRWYEI